MTSAQFGVGAYTPGEAARLLNMQPITLRRWLYGYDYDHHDAPGHQPPLWMPQYDAEQDGQLLGFRDLIEARIVHALRIRQHRTHLYRILGRIYVDEIDCRKIYAGLS